MYGDDYYDDDEYFSDLTWAEGGFEVAPLGSKKKKKKRTSDDEDYDELDYELKEFQDFSKKKVSKAKEIEKKLSAQANEFLKNAGFNSKGLNPEQLQKDSDEQVDELLQTMNEELKKQADSKKEEEQLRKKCVAMAKKAKENAKKLDVNTTVNNTATVFQIKDIDSGEGNAVTVHFEHPYGRNYQSKSEWKEKRKEHAKKGEYMTPQQFEKWLNTPLKFNNPEEYIRKMQENLKKESEAEAKRIAERYTAPLTKREIFEREKAKGKESLSRYLQDRVAKQLADLIMAGFYKDTDYDVSDLDTEKQQKKGGKKPYGRISLSHLKKQMKPGSNDSSRKTSEEDKGKHVFTKNFSPFIWKA